MERDFNKEELYFELIPMERDFNEKELNPEFSHNEYSFVARFELWSRDFPRNKLLSKMSVMSYPDDVIEFIEN